MTLVNSLDQLDFLYILLILILILLVIYLIYRLQRSLSKADPISSLSKLAEIGQVISNTPLDIDELAEVAYVETVRYLETDFFQLGLFEEEYYRTIICLHHGKQVENREIPISEDPEGILGWLHRTGNSLLVADFSKGTPDLPRKHTFDTSDPPMSGLFVPLIVGEEVIGAISILSHRPNTFTDEHERLLSFIAHNVASSFALALLHNEVTFRKVQLLRIEDIARQLISPAPLPSRLTEVVLLIMDIFEYDAVAIYETVEGDLKLLASSTEPTNLPPLDRAFCEEAINAGTSKLRESISPPESTGIENQQPYVEFCVPLIAEKYALGLLQLVQKRTIDVPPDQNTQIEMIAANIAMAMLESRNYARQQEENWITTVLLEVARHASQPGDIEQALQAVLQLTTLLTGRNWALLLVPDGQDSHFRLGPNAGLRRQTQFFLADARFSLESFKLDSDQAFTDPISVNLPDEISKALEAKTALVVPVLSDKDLIGLFLLEGKELVERQLSLINGIANQISLRLENFRLIEEVALRRSLERELETAKSIQESFLPRNIPSYPGWEIGVTWRVARQVGGDFYDFIPLNTEDYSPRWGIVIADVTDKGIPASLFMALCRTMLRSVSMSHIDPGKTLSRLNELIFADTQADLLISVFYAVWEPRTARFSYANAGHNPPLLFYPQQPAKILRDHGMVIGATLNANYSTQTLKLSPGELIVLYTDGVTEASDKDGQMFGLHRLENLVLGLEPWSAQNIADLIEKRVSDFCSTPDLPDDLTTVVLHRPL